MEKPQMKSNYGLGPRTGVASRKGKREEFRAGKSQRANLADAINSAFKTRNPKPTFVTHTLENVKEPIRAPKFKR